MLRLVSYYTDTHKAMCERFVMQRAWGFDDRRFVQYGQTCPTGDFKSDGWNACMLDKLRTLMGLPTDGITTLYVDADVALMPGLAAWCESASHELEHDSVAFSDDRVQWCAGIMLFKCTPAVQRFWELIADLSQAWDYPDQEVIHLLRAQCDERRGRLPITPSVLPKELFCNWSTVNLHMPRPWNREPFAVPKTCLAWHANWTVGIANKMAMLDRVVLAETSVTDVATA